MASLLYRLGTGAFRHRFAVLMAWVSALAIAGTCMFAFGGETDDEFTIPGSESQQALDTMATTFPTAAGTSVQIVFAAPDGHQITEPRYVNAVNDAMVEARKAPQVAAVNDPMQPKTLSKDKSVALGQVQYKVDRHSLDTGSLDSLERAIQPAQAAGLSVEVGGAAYGNSPSEGNHAEEAVGVLIALGVLTVTFGSLFAAGMPLMTALAGVAVGLLGLLSLTGKLTISSTAPTLALMLGLAVGIDYALFILSRHRSQLAAGMTAQESAATATATAGSAVVFAGLTVAIALAGLSVAQIPFLTVMGLSAAATVLIAIAVAVTLLPALMGFAGDRLRPKSGSRAARREHAAHQAGDDVQGPAAGAGERWGRFVTRKPLLTLVTVTVALLALAVPARDLQLALPDNGMASSDSSQRKAYDLIAQSFGPGYNGPLLILADTTHTQDADEATAAIAHDLKSMQDVASVNKPQLNSESHSAIIQVVPDSGPQDEETKDLVQSIRDQATDWQKEHGAEVSVAGSTAVSIDVSNRLADSLAPFTLVVVGISLLLLLLVFRSLIIPIKASIGFLLSVAASLGAVVAIFQWGWLADVLGVDKAGPVVSFLPIILMAVLFGLAMDYEVFLVSRMHESRRHGAGPRQAILAGTRHASRVVTAAALIMLAVFAGFIPGADAIFKPIAFSLAFGVLVDAFAVRMTFVPAVLAILGNKAWWMPKWLHRLLPNLDIEGEQLNALRQHTPIGQTGRTQVQQPTAADH